MRDGGHLHREIEILERHVTMTFAERPLRLEHLRIDQSLDHDLCIGGDSEVDGARLAVRIGSPASAPATAISS